MAVEEIGGVSVSISGDFSQLQRDMDAAVSAARATGAAIAGAFVDGTASATAGSYQFITAAQKIIDVQKDLDRELVAAKAALVDIKLAYDSGAASALDLARATQNLENATQKAQGSFLEVKRAVQETKSGFQSFAEGVVDWVKNPLESAGNAAKGFLTSIGPMGAIVSATAVGVALLGKEITELVLAQGAAAEKTQNFADRLQLSFQETRQLSEMANIAGVNIGVLERTSQRLATAFEDSGGAGKKVAEALDSIGIAADGTGRTMVKVLEHLASIPDAGERIALAHKIMGRGAIELEPLLKNYQALRSAVEALGGTITNDMVKAMTDADDAAGKLGIAWDHVKDSLAATFAPAVTAGLDVLTRLLTGPPTSTLEAQINTLISQINKLKLAADDAGSSMGMMMTGGLADGGFTNKGRLAQLEAELKKLQELPAAQKEAIARSKEYNDELDKSNRAAQVWVQGEKDRAKAAADAAYKIALARQEENRQAVALYRAQQAEVKALADALKYFHVIESDPAHEHAKLLMGQLTYAYSQGKISLKDLTNAQADYNKVFGYDFATYADKALVLIDQMDEKWKKLSQSIAYQRELLRSPEFSDRAKAMLEDLNSNVPFDPAMEARRKGTPLGDALLRAGVDRDTGHRKSVDDLNAALESQEATLLEIEVIWGRARGEIQRLATHDLPAAATAYQGMIDFARSHGESIGRVMQLEQEQLRLIVQEKTLRGESATAAIIASENLRIKQEALIEQSQRWGKLYVELIQDFHGAFQTLGKGIVDAITGVTSWHKAWHDALARISTMILDTLVGTALNALSTQLLKLITDSDGLWGSLSKVAGVLGGKGADLAGTSITGVTGPGSVIGGIGGPSPADIAKYGKPGGATPGGGGGILNSLGGLGGVLSLGVDVASGIATGIQLAHIESDVAKIEISTRQTKEQLTGGIQFALNTYLPELTHLVDIWGALATPLQNIQDILRYATIHVTTDTSDLRTGGSAYDWQIEQNKNLPGGSNNPGGQGPGTGGTTGGVYADPTTGMVVNAEKLSRGFNVLAGAVRNTTSMYQLKPGEYVIDPNRQFPVIQMTGVDPSGKIVASLKDIERWQKAVLALGVGPELVDAYTGHFRTDFGPTRPLTNAEAIEQGTRRLGPGFKEAMDAYYAGLSAEQKARISPTDVYQSTFTNSSIFSQTGDPAFTTQRAAQRDALEKYRAGVISLTEYTSLSDTAVRIYQRSVASLETLINQLGIITDRNSPEALGLITELRGRGVGVSIAGGATPGYSGGHRYPTDFTGSNFSAGYIAMQQAGGHTAFDQGNSSFTNLGGSTFPLTTQMPGNAAQFGQQLSQMAATRQQQHAAFAQDHPAYLEESARLAQIELQKLYDRGLLTYEQYAGRYAQEVAPLLARAKQLHNYAFRWETMMDGTKRGSFDSTFRSYSASPIDYPQSLQNYSNNLNTSWVAPNDMSYFTPPGMNPQGGDSVGGGRTVVIQAFDPAARAIGRGLVEELQNNGIYR